MAGHITSADGSVTIANPLGPEVDLSVVPGDPWTRDDVPGDVTSLDSTMVFPADGQDIEFSGKIVTAVTGGTDFSLQPNTDAANQTGVSAQFDDGGGTVVDPFTIIELTRGANAVGEIQFLCRICQPVGSARMFYLEIWQDNGGTISHVSASYRWNVTTHITGLRLLASTASGLRNGTFIRGRVVR